MFGRVAFFLDLGDNLYIYTVYVRDVKSIISFQYSKKWAIKHEHGDDVILNSVKKIREPSFSGVAALFGETEMHESQPKSKVDINMDHI